MNSFNNNYFLCLLSPKIISSGTRVSTYQFEEDTNIESLSNGYGTLCPGIKAQARRNGHMDEEAWNIKNEKSNNEQKENTKLNPEGKNRYWKENFEKNKIFFS